jgi:hypothetical protein
MEQNKELRNTPHKYSQLIFLKKQKQHNGAKTIFSINGVKAVEIYVKKNEDKHRPDAFHRN